MYTEGSETQGTWPAFLSLFLSSRFSPSLHPTPRIVPTLSHSVVRKRKWSDVERRVAQWRKRERQEMRARALLFASACCAWSCRHVGRTTALSEKQAIRSPSDSWNLIMSHNREIARESKTRERDEARERKH